MADLPHSFPGYIQVEETQFEAAVSEYTMQKFGSAINAIIDKALKVDEYLTAGSYSWVVPLGTTVVLIEACGGGGGGGATTAGSGGGNSYFNGNIIGFGGGGGAAADAGGGAGGLGFDVFEFYYGGNGRQNTGPVAAQSGQTSGYFSGGTGQIDAIGFANGGGGGASRYGSGGNGGTFNSQNGKNANGNGAGGGGGNGSYNGGGGGCGCRTQFLTVAVTPGATIPIVVGAGGAGGSNGGAGGDGLIRILYNA